MSSLMPAFRSLMGCLILSQALQAAPSFESFTISTTGKPSSSKSKGLDLCIAHYNLENLFDTLNDPKVNDEEFLPQSPLNWNSQKYYAKLGALARCISSINRGDVPDLLGLCEMENDAVLKDLCRQPELRTKNLAFLHSASSDPRGIDVAILYRKDRFKPFARKDLRVSLPGDTSPETRNILIVSGKLSSGDTLHLLVNHWPSRRGGVEKSAPNRYAASRSLRKAVDSLFALYRGADHCRLVLLGDFNDTPLDPSIRLILGADSLSTKGLFHPFAGLDSGSYCYQDRWEWLDQIILSTALKPTALKPTASQNPDAVPSKTKGLKSPPTYLAGSASALRLPGLLQTDGKFQGYPFRTYAGTRYLGGPSDHLPVMVYLRCPQCP